MFHGVAEIQKGWDMWWRIECTNHPSNSELYPRPVVRRRSFRTPDAFSALAECGDFGHTESSKYQMSGLWNFCHFDMVVWHTNACKDSQTNACCNFIVSTTLCNCNNIHIYIIYVYPSDIHLIATVKISIYTGPMSRYFGARPIFRGKLLVLGSVVCPLRRALTHCFLTHFWKPSVAKSTQAVLWNLLKFASCHWDPWNCRCITIHLKFPRFHFWRCVQGEPDFNKGTFQYALHCPAKICFNDVCNIWMQSDAIPLPTHTSKVWFDPGRACRSFLLWPFVRWETEQG